MSVLKSLWEVVKLPGGSRAKMPAEQPRAMLMTYDEWMGSGEWVTPSTAIRNVAVLACVRVLAESVAALPLKLYRRTANGKQEAADHPLWDVLHNIANTELTSFELRELLMAHLLLWGNCYCEIEMNGRADVLGLWPIRPDRVEVLRTDSGRLAYVVRNEAGQVQNILPAYRVLHIRGLGADGIVGYSPVTLARNAVGLAQTMERLGNAIFANGASPGGALRHPGKLSEAAYTRLMESWQARHQGVGNVNRVAILEEGMDWKEIGMPLDDAQFLETRKFQTSEIARLYRVPPHKIGDLDRATFSNVEQQEISFVVDTLTPWCVRIEQAIMRDLIGVRERQALFAEFAVQGRMRGDMQTRYNAYAVGRQWGWLSRNDIRRLENLDTIDGGDDYLTPLNMSVLGKEPPAPAAQVARQWIGDACRRIEQRAADRDPKHAAWISDVLQPLFRAAGEPDEGAAELALNWVRDGLTVLELHARLRALFE